jgi:putative membrane protein
LAKTKSKDKKVLKFADTMIDDHTKAQNDLSEIAQKVGVALPQQSDAKHAQLLKKMQAMEPADFDRAYKSQAVKDHGEAQKLLKKIRTDGKNAEFKVLAEKLTAPIDKHMQMAKAMQAKS